MPKIAAYEIEAVDIDEYPDRIPSDAVDFEVTELTIGDLHGNALKLLHFLLIHDIIDISQENYYLFRDIYRKEAQAGWMSTELDEHDLEQFAKVLDSIKVKNTSILIRLIGDEFADRGANDYFVLKLLEKLHQGKVPFEILLSNHSLDFIAAYEAKKRNVDPNSCRIINFQQSCSLSRLDALVQKYPIIQEGIDRMITQIYQPHLKVISYSLQDTKDDIQPHLTIFSHAAIGLRAIELLAEKFKQPYHDNNAVALATTIDQINVYFFREYVQKNSVFKSYQSKYIMPFYEKKSEPSCTIENVLEFTLWSRAYEDGMIDRPAQNNGYSIHWAHGHDFEVEPPENVYSLDSNVGKSLPYHSGGNHVGLISAGRHNISLSHQSIPPSAAASQAGLFKKTRNLVDAQSVTAIPKKLIVMNFLDLLLAHRDLKGFLPRKKLKDLDNPVEFNKITLFLRDTEFHGLRINNYYFSCVPSDRQAWEIACVSEEEGQPPLEVISRISEKKSGALTASVYDWILDNYENFFDALRTSLLQAKYQELHSATWGGFTHCFFNLMDDRLYPGSYSLQLDTKNEHLVIQSSQSGVPPQIITDPCQIRHIQTLIYRNLDPTGAELVDKLQRQLDDQVRIDRPEPEKHRPF